MLCARQGSGGHSFWSPRIMLPVDRSGIAAAGKISRGLWPWVSTYDEGANWRRVASVRDDRTDRPQDSGWALRRPVSRQRFIRRTLSGAEMIGWFAIP